MADKLTNDLANTAPAAPFPKFDKGKLAALKDLARIFQRARTKDTGEPLRVERVINERALRVEPMAPLREE